MKILKGTNIHRDLLLIYKRIKYQKNDCIINTVHIPKECSLGRGCRIEYGVHLGKDTIIGDWSYLRDDSYLWPHSRIGKYCSIGERVSIGVPMHPINFVSTSSVLYHHHEIEKFCIWPEDDILEPVIIGNDVWIGNNVTIMQGITVGNGAVLGAGAVVTHDVEPYSIVIGCPAKEIKKRFSDDLIEQLEKIKWWDFEYKKLIKLMKNLSNVEEFLKKARG